MRISAWRGCSGVLVRISGKTKTLTNLPPRENGETSPRAQQEDIGKRVQEQTAIMTVHIGATLLSPRPVHRQSYGKHSSLLSAKAKLGTTLLCLQWR